MVGGDTSLITLITVKLGYKRIYIYYLNVLLFILWNKKCMMIILEGTLHKVMRGPLGNVPQN